VIFWKVTLIDTAGGSQYALMDQARADHALDMFKQDLAATTMTVEGVTDNAKRDPVTMCIRRENLMSVLVEKL